MLPAIKMCKFVILNYPYLIYFPQFQRLKLRKASLRRIQEPMDAFGSKEISKAYNRVKTVRCTNTETKWMRKIKKSLSF